MAIRWGIAGHDPAPDPTQLAQTLQAFAAGLMFFDPFTPGSPFCPGECTSVTSAGMDYPSLIKDIGNMMPGNPVINEWLANYAGGAGGLLGHCESWAAGFFRGA